MGAHGVSEYTVEALTGAGILIEVKPTSLKRWAIFLTDALRECVFYDIVDEFQIDSYTDDHFLAVRLPNVITPPVLDDSVELDAALEHAGDLLDMTDKELEAIPAPVLEKPGRP
jgi:hypothetical protein